MVSPSFSGTGDGSGGAASSTCAAAAGWFRPDLAVAFFGSVTSFSSAPRGHPVLQLDQSGSIRPRRRPP